ncbi:hypothetical protein [Alkalibacillus silvisoli]|uniref:Uncharacterized protein n=1 Tax=Alkalibacillus silvisoli TaxID=392823 RepID=A0ABN0ZNP7_9BACI
MKNFSIFLVSFMVLFIAIQWLSGVILTYTYTPNIQEAWEMSEMLSQQVTLASSPTVATLIIAIIAATIAYITPKMVRKIMA